MPSSKTCNGGRCVTLADLNIFELIDRKLLSDFAQAVAARTLSTGACSQIIRQRRQSHWFNRYEQPYTAIDIGAQFIDLVGKVGLTITSLAEGIRQYVEVWYRVDQLYRQFIYFRGQGRPAHPVAALPGG